MANGTRTIGCAVLLSGLILITGCGRKAERREATPRAANPRAYMAGPYQLDLASGDQRLCTSVVLLVDVSGSMQQHVNDGQGGRIPKDQQAKQALQAILDHTRDWKSRHPDRTLEVGLFTFSSRVSRVLEMDGFDPERFHAAIQKMPFPNGGTAIGLALEQAAQSLMGGGCTRKHVICITDGQNTSGIDPAVVSRYIHQETDGAVAFHFIAFDTQAGHFSFVRNVDGQVVEATDGVQLKQQLTEIYEKRILAEAMPAEAAAP